MSITVKYDSYGKIPVVLKGYKLDKKYHENQWIGGA